MKRIQTTRQPSFQQGHLKSQSSSLIDDRPVTFEMDSTNEIEILNQKLEAQKILLRMKDDELQGLRTRIASTRYSVSPEQTSRLISEVDEHFSQGPVREAARLKQSFHQLEPREIPRIEIDRSETIIVEDPQFIDMSRMTPHSKRYYRGKIDTGSQTLLKKSLEKIKKPQALEDKRKKLAKQIIKAKHENKSRDEEIRMWKSMPTRINRIQKNSQHSPSQVDITELAKYLIMKVGEESGNYLKYRKYERTKLIRKRIFELGQVFNLCMGQLKEYYENNISVDETLKLMVTIEVSA